MRAPLWQEPPSYRTKTRVTSAKLRRSSCESASLFEGIKTHALPSSGRRPPAPPCPNQRPSCRKDAHLATNNIWDPARCCMSSEARNLGSQNHPSTSTREAHPRRQRPLRHELRVIAGRTRHEPHSRALRGAKTKRWKRRTRRN